eukprot:TCALIF_05128-PA protein Name:"Similar to dnk Deoxynucleoside kinase (Drosophila melanogaster)" AED:0.11 eAED:0.11 QI:0/0.16/0.28/0.71/0.83/0.71/7/1278/362
MRPAFSSAGQQVQWPQSRWAGGGPLPPPGKPALSPLMSSAVRREWILTEDVSFPIRKLSGFRKRALFRNRGKAPARQPPRAPPRHDEKRMRHNNIKDSESDSQGRKDECRPILALPATTNQNTDLSEICMFTQLKPQAFHGMDPPTIQSRLIMTSAPRRPFTIVVEGNIGSGKSTFLNEFQDLSNELEIMPEPVDKWRNCHGTNLLQRMYEDPKRWSMLFQTYVQLTMMQQHTKPCAKPTRIMERSLLRQPPQSFMSQHSLVMMSQRKSPGWNDARYCFVENLYAEGKLEDCEYAVLSEWFNYLLTCPSMNFKIDLIIYLRTRPDVAFQRIKDRDRSEECRIPFQYIQDLHDLHEDCLFKPL